MPKVELLYFEGCPGAGPTYELLRRILRQEGIEAKVDRILVADADAARDRQFPGSPTVRIDGVDLEDRGPADSTEHAWSCRRYLESEPGQPGAVPSAELIRRRLRELGR